MRGQKSFSGVASAEAPVLRTQHARTSTLKRCLAQQQAVTSNRNQGSRTRLAKTVPLLFFGRPPRPRSASVCPLDNGGLIGVSQHGSERPATLCFVSLLLLPAVCFVVHSFQSRPTQGDKMPLQHRRIFNRHALFVHFE